MYRVQIKAMNDSVLRTEEVLEPKYVYEIEKNKADSAGRNYKVAVSRVDDNGNASPPAVLVVNNPPPDAPQSVTTKVYADIGMEITPVAPVLRDLAGMKVWLSATSGFTPSDSNLVYDGADLTATVPLPLGAATYYFRCAFLDTFDRNIYTISNQFSRVVTESDLTIGLREAQEAITQLQVDLAGVDAEAVQQLQVQVENLEGVVASQATAITTATTTANNASSTAQLALEAVADTNGILAATAQLIVDVNGRITGIKAFDNGAESLVSIVADKFEIVNATDNSVKPFQVLPDGTVVLQKLHIKDIDADENFALNAGVSFGVMGLANQFAVLSTSFSDMSGMTNIQRVLDSDGVSLLIAQFAMWSTSDNGAVEVIVKNQRPDNSIVDVTSSPFVTHRWAEADRPQMVTGIAAIESVAGTHKYTFQWRSLFGQQINCSVRRFILLHFKKSSFSGLYGQSGGGGGGLGGGGIIP